MQCSLPKDVYFSTVRATNKFTSLAAITRNILIESPAYYLSAFFDVGAGGLEGTAELVFFDLTIPVDETDGSEMVCVQLDLSAEIDSLGCPLTVTLSFYYGPYAGM